jgi:hypothetical protein
MGATNSEMIPVTFGRKYQSLQAIIHRTMMPSVLDEKIVQKNALKSAKTSAKTIVVGMMALMPWTTFLASSCKIEGETTLKDVEPKSANVDPGMPLDINEPGFSSAKFSLTAHSGTLLLWSMTPDTGVNATIAGRIAPYHLDQPIAVDSKLLDYPTGRISASTAHEAILFTGPSGPTKNFLPNVIPIRKNADRPFIDTGKLSEKFFSACPTNFFASDGPLMAQLKTHQSSAKLSLESSDNNGPAVDRIVLRPKGLTWSIHCVYALNWSDIAETKIMADLEFELRLESDVVIFPQALSAKGTQPSVRDTTPTEQGNHGTRYQKDYAAKNSDEAPVYRWRPKNKSIVIDDQQDTLGRSLSDSEEGRLLQEGLKIATADLRIKFAALGNTIQLRSEKPALTANVVFALEDTSGADLLMIDDATGEIGKARLKIGKKSLRFGQLKMLEEFEKLGLIENKQHSEKDAFLSMVMCDFGEILGLRANYAGYGMINNWGNDLQSMMSFASIAVPMELLSDRVEWKDHDLLSLEILYADLSPDLLATRENLIQKVLAFPLSPDESIPGNRPNASNLPFEAAIRYLGKSSHPRLVRFRETDSDWRNKIAAIYQNVYGWADADAQNH